MERLFEGTFITGSEVNALLKEIKASTNSPITIKRSYSMESYVKNFGSKLPENGDFFLSKFGKPYKTVTFNCKHGQGRSSLKVGIRDSKTFKVECPFMFSLSYCMITNKYLVSDVCLDHKNHYNDSSLLKRYPEERALKNASTGNFVLRSFFLIFFNFFHL